MLNFKIDALDANAMEECRLRIDNLTKPIYSLCHLELMVERLAGILNNRKPKDLKMAMVIFGADHATDGPQNRTHGVESAALMERMNRGTTATEVAAKKMGAQVILIDVGLEKDVSHLENVRSEKVMKGSHFFGRHEAMSEEETGRALEIGFGLACEMKAEGFHVVGLGNVGERAGLTALALTAAVTQYDMSQLLEDNQCSLTVSEKAKSLSATLARYDVSHGTGYEMLQAVGAPDVAAMVGFILGAAMNHMAIVFDNDVTGAAALVAIAINEQVKDYLFQSAVYDNPVHRAQMKWLDRKAYLHYGFTAEEGLGSVMGLSLIEASLHMLNDMKTFGEASVNVAEDGPGNERQKATVVEEND